MDEPTDKLQERLRLSIAKLEPRDGDVILIRCDDAVRADEVLGETLERLTSILPVKVALLLVPREWDVRQLSAEEKAELLEQLRAADGFEPIGERA